MPPRRFYARGRPFASPVVRSAPPGPVGYASRLVAKPGAITGRCNMRWPIVSLVTASSAALLVMLTAGTAAAPEGKPKMIFEDTFDKRPGEGWTWVRENRDAWRVKDGALEIRVEPGRGNEVKNVLLR